MTALFICALPGFAQDQEAPSTADPRAAEEVYRFSDADTANATDGAVDPSDDGTAASGDGEVVGGAAFGLSDLLRMVLVLVLVIGAVYGVLALLRKKGRPPEYESSAIRLLASQTLPGNKAVHAVQVGNTVYLLGAAEGGMTVISTVTDQETVDTLVLEHSRQQSASSGGFSALLNRWLTGSSGAAEGGASTPGAEAFSAGQEAGGVLQVQRQRLRGLG